jgi:hypothetical protein
MQQTQNKQDKKRILLMFIARLFGNGHKYKKRLKTKKEKGTRGL